MRYEHKIEKKDPSNYSYNDVVLSESWKAHRSDEYFRYRENWSKFPNERVVSDFPLHLDIETTNKCNLKCPMCALTILEEEGKGDSPDSARFMSREQYQRIIDEAAEHGVASIKLQYLGEPLLHKDLAWQIKYAKEKGVIDVMFNTNASALTQTNSKKILEAGIDDVFVSMDAISPDLYEEKRVGTSLGKVIDNVHSLIKLRNEAYPHVQVRISMVMYDDPVWQQQFDGLVTMWSNLVDSVGYGLFNQRGDDRDDEAFVDGYVCEQLFQRMFLRLDGNVIVCCVDSENEYVVGNWQQESLKDIWHNQRYKMIREQHISNKYNEIDVCRKCWMPGMWQELNKI